MRERAFTSKDIIVILGLLLFTLILAIIIPTDRPPRESSRTDICLSNQKSLALAWMMYAEENNDFLVGGYVSADTESWPNCWVLPPEENSLTSEKSGLQNGMLYSYVQYDYVFNCPKDRRELNNSGYRSYSIAGGLNGEDRNIAVKKLNEIIHPGLKYVFVEETHPTSWTRGSWLGSTEGDYWRDPIAVWHGPNHRKQNQSTLSYADGHAETYTWQDERTLDMTKTQKSNQYQPDNFDLKFMQQGYAHKKIELKQREAN